MSLVLFYIAGVITLGGALAVVTTRNIVYAAFGLLASLIGVAGLFLLAFAEFLALVQILDRWIARASNRGKERLINSYGKFRSPTTERGNLDLQLWHKTLRAGRPPIRTTYGIRKRRSLLVIL